MNTMQKTISSSSSATTDAEGLSQQSSFVSIYSATTATLTADASEGDESFTTYTNTVDSRTTQTTASTYLINSSLPRSTTPRPPTPLTGSRLHEETNQIQRLLRSSSSSTSSSSSYMNNENEDTIIKPVNPNHVYSSSGTFASFSSSLEDTITNYDQQQKNYLGDNDDLQQDKQKTKDGKDDVGNQGKALTTSSTSTSTPRNHHMENELFKNLGTASPATTPLSDDDGSSNLNDKYTEHHYIDNNHHKKRTDTNLNTNDDFYSNSDDIDDSFLNSRSSSSAKSLLQVKPNNKIMTSVVESYQPFAVLNNTEGKDCDVILSAQEEERHRQHDLSKEADSTSTISTIQTLLTSPSTALRTSTNSNNNNDDNHHQHNQLLNSNGDLSEEADDTTTISTIQTPLITSSPATRTSTTSYNNNDKNHHEHNQRIKSIDEPLSSSMYLQINNNNDATADPLDIIQNSNSTSSGFFTCDNSQSHSNNTTNTRTNDSINKHSTVNSITKTAALSLSSAAAISSFLPVTSPSPTSMTLCNRSGGQQGSGIRSGGGSNGNHHSQEQLLQSLMKDTNEMMAYREEEDEDYDDYESNFQQQEQQQCSNKKLYPSNNKNMSVSVDQRSQMMEEDFQMFNMKSNTTTSTTNTDYDQQQEHECYHQQHHQQQQQRLSPVPGKQLLHRYNPNPTLNSSSSIGSSVVSRKSQTSTNNNEHCYNNSRMNISNRSITSNNNSSNMSSSLPSFESNNHINGPNSSSNNMSSSSSSLKQQSIDNDFGSLNERATEQLSRGQNEHAVVTYEEILSLSRYQISLHKHDSNGNSIEAQQQTSFFRLVIADTLNNLGVVHEMQQDYTLGLSACREALRLYNKQKLDIGSFNSTSFLQENKQNVERTIFNLNQMEKAKSTFVGRTQIHADAERYWNSKNYGMALDCLQRVFEVEKRSLGGGHATVATTLRDMGTLLCCFDCTTKTEESTAVVASKMLQTGNGTDNKYTKSTADNIAKGIKCYIKSLKILKIGLGDFHPEVIETYLTMAAFYDRASPPVVVIAIAATADISPSKGNNPTRRQEKTGENSYDHGATTALELYTQAMQAQRSCFGKCHLKIASTCNNIGILHYGLGDYQDAMKSYKQAMDIYSRANLDRGHVVDSAGVGHNKNLTSGSTTTTPPRNNHKRNIKGVNEEEENEQDHRADVALIWNNIGVIHLEWEEYDDAMNAFTIALDIFKSMQIAPTIITSQSSPDDQNYAVKGGEEQVTFGNSTITNSSMGGGNSGTTNSNEVATNNTVASMDFVISDRIASILQLMGKVYTSKRQYYNAVMVYEEVLAMQRNRNNNNRNSAASPLQHYSPNKRGTSKSSISSSILTSINALPYNASIATTSLSSIAFTIDGIGEIYELMGDLQKSSSYYTQSLSLRQKNLGINHFEVSLSLQRLSSIYEKRREFDEARICLTEVLRIYQQQEDDGNDDLFWNSCGHTTTSTTATNRQQQRNNKLEDNNGSITSICSNSSIGALPAMPTRRTLTNAMRRAQRSLARIEQEMIQLQKGMDPGGVSMVHVGGTLTSPLRQKNNCGQQQRQQYQQFSQQIYDNTFSSSISTSINADGGKGGLYLEDGDLEARSLDKIAKTHVCQQNYEKAISVYSEALRIRRKMRGDNHADVGVTLAQIASVKCRHQRQHFGGCEYGGGGGELSAAMAIFGEALRVYRVNNFSENHPYVKAVRKEISKARVGGGTC